MVFHGWEEDFYSGNGLYSTLEGAEGLMDAWKSRNYLSPLHAEFESLIWAMEYMTRLQQFHIMFAADCSQLVKIVSEPKE